MILDEPQDKAPARKRITWFELVLACIIPISSIGSRVFFVPYTYEVSVLSAMLLGAGYLLAYYWIDKPLTTTVRTVSISILYGVSFCFAMLIFLGLGTISNDLVKYTAFVLIAFFGVMLADFLSSPKRSMVASSLTFVRISVFVALMLGRVLLHFIYYR